MFSQSTWSFEIGLLIQYPCHAYNNAVKLIQLSRQVCNKNANIQEKKKMKEDISNLMHT